MVISLNLQDQMICWKQIMPPFWGKGGGGASFIFVVIERLWVNTIIANQFCKFWCTTCSHVYLSLWALQVLISRVPSKAFNSFPKEHQVVFDLLLFQIEDFYPCSKKRCVCSGCNSWTFNSSYLSWCFPRKIFVVALGLYMFHRVEMYFINSNSGDFTY
jgi:hypothetical protein